MVFVQTLPSLAFLKYPQYQTSMPVWEKPVFRLHPSLDDVGNRFGSLFTTQTRLTKNWQLSNMNDKDNDAPPPLPSSLGQKRPLCELSGGADDSDRLKLNLVEQEPELATTATTQQHDDDNDDDGTTRILPPTSFQKLRLEAIFYPKFDNEKQQELNRQEDEEDNEHSPDDSLAIRQQMKQRIQQQLGYLEVTLKHSGSLLLWSGGSRYYSKNSNDNVFTMVGEIIVRQHFYRAWFKEDDTKEQDSNVLKPPKGESMYQACSDYLEQHRLTIAMELVTSVLGHHGAVPNQDYIMVTALARRDCYNHKNSDSPLPTRPSWFATTPELLQFCQQFRLPHNDVWMLTSSSSVNGVLDAFDDTWREVGTASSVIPAITALADIHVASMYPHDIFQGDILEGMVVRYVPFSQRQEGSDAKLDIGSDKEPIAVMERMKSLATEAEEIRQHLVPANRPPSFQLPPFNDGNKSIGSIQLRSLFEKCDGWRPDGLTRLKKSLQDVFKNIYNMSRRVERVPKTISSHFPDWVEPLLKSSHEESRQIARLIHVLDGLPNRVAYNVWREVNDANNSSRWLCMIHVMHDTTFTKYRRKMRPGDMELFRGFCLEFGNWDEENVDETDHLHLPEADSVPSLLADSKVENDAALMLKMKLLPYMVRTFACRSGLRVIKQGGAGAFHTFCIDLLKRWQISDEAKAKWIPFLQAWGDYAQRSLEQEETELSSLGPLSASFYLHHLEEFTRLYNSGALAPSTNSGCVLRGLVVVVALDSETAKSVARVLAQQLGGPKVVYDVNKIKPEDVLLAKALGSGVICGTIVTHGKCNLQKLLKEHGSHIFVLLFGCSDANIDKVIVPENEKRKCKAMMNSWRSIKHFEVDESSLAVEKGDELKFSQNDALADFVETLRVSSKASPEDDARHGLVVFFPGIPGCGKSTICSTDTISKLQSKLSQRTKTFESAERSKEPPPKARNVVVRSGDAVTQKYWKLVQEERTKDVSCVYIADKNVPPTWETAGKVCAKSKGVAVPVIPDKGAIQTTVIAGLTRPDGSLAPNVRHVYPFSLQYLAVCMVRVLDRPEKSHQGKLDPGTKYACWIVLRFYSFYQGITADTFLSTLRDQLEAQGAFTSQSAITLPFFVEENPPALPYDLEQLLLEALQIEFGRKSKKIKPDDQVAIELEGRLRAALAKYRDQLLRMTVDASVSQESFIQQITAAVEEVDALPPNATLKESLSFVKIVSIDLDRDDVISVVNANVNKLTPFMEQILRLKTADPSINNSANPSVNETADPSVNETADPSVNETADPSVNETADPTINTSATKLFAKNLHVTMCHHHNVLQPIIHETYDSLCDKSVEIEVTGLLWNEDIAALAVVVPKSTIDGCPLPLPSNEFTHVTLWHMKEITPFSSNELPGLVVDGLAHQIDFDCPAVLRGRISFWDANKH